MAARAYEADVHTFITCAHFLFLIYVVDFLIIYADSQTVAMRAVAREVRRAADLSIVLSVERGLGVLGVSGKATILHYLEKTGMRIEDVPQNMQSFQGFLQCLLGRGAFIIEDEIESSLRRLESLDPANVSLTAAFEELRERGAWSQRHPR